MTELFVDTWFWIALLHDKDNHHALALNLRNSVLANRRVVTSMSVLGEVLDYFSKRGSVLRQVAVDLIPALSNDPNVSVVPRSQDSFNESLTLYSERSDKKYSQVDCESMVLMRQRRIQEVVTNDHHFEQEGFTKIGP